MSLSFLKIAEHIEVDSLVEQLTQHPNLWNENNHRVGYEGSPHAESQDIWVRFGVGSFEEMAQPHDSEWYESSELLTQAKRIAFQIMSAVCGERLGGVLITKLPPGGKIHPHIDKGWHAEYYEKFYISLTSPKGSVFSFEEGEIISNSGDCYLFRNDRLHWVTNDSGDTRLTMIACIKTDLFKGV